MDEQLNLIAGHLNNYAYELRRAGLVDFRAAMLAEASGALKSIQRKLDQDAAEIAGLKNQIEDAKEKDDD